MKNLRGMWCGALELNQNSRGGSIRGNRRNRANLRAAYLRQSAFPRPTAFYAVSFSALGLLLGYQNGRVKPQSCAFIIDYLGFCKLVTKPLDRLPIRAQNLSRRRKIKPRGFRALHAVYVVYQLHKLAVLRC